MYSSIRLDYISHKSFSTHDYSNIKLSYTVNKGNIHSKFIINKYVIINSFQMHWNQLLVLFKQMMEFFGLRRNLFSIQIRNNIM